MTHLKVKAIITLFLTNIETILKLQKSDIKLRNATFKFR